jgi:hypothetical protein
MLKFFRYCFSQVSSGCICSVNSCIVDYLISIMFYGHYYVTRFCALLIFSICYRIYLTRLNHIIQNYSNGRYAKVVAITLQFSYLFVPYCCRICRLRGIVISRVFHVSHSGSCAVEHVSYILRFFGSAFFAVPECHFVHSTGFQCNAWS